MTVKIGDYVKIKPGVVAISGYTVGEPYEVRATEIIGVDSSNVRLYTAGGKRQWFGPDEYEIVKATPKVGDTIRATRGETVISGTVEYVASGSYAAAAGNFNVRLDGKPESFFWVQKDDDFTVEIIKPKVVLPIKLGAIIKHNAPSGSYTRTYVRISSSYQKSWIDIGDRLIINDSNFTNSINMGSLEILFEGVDIP